jgi:hypothetical protein
MSTFNRKRQIMEQEPSTQDEIIEMWGEVVKYAPSEVRITEFAKLIAQAEREACAKVIENYPHWVGKTAKTEISNAIRAEKNT